MMPTWVLIVAAFFVGCFVAFGLLVWVSGRLERLKAADHLVPYRLDPTIVLPDFNSHARDAIDAGDGTR